MKIIDKANIFFYNYNCDVCVLAAEFNLICLLFRSFEDGTSSFINGIMLSMFFVILLAGMLVKVEREKIRRNSITNAFKEFEIEHWGAHRLVREKVKTRYRLIGAIEYQVDFYYNKKLIYRYEWAPPGMPNNLLLLLLGSHPDL